MIAYIKEGVIIIAFVEYIWVFRHLWKPCLKHGIVWEKFFPEKYIIANIIPAHTGRKFNVAKTFRRRPGRFLNVLCTFDLRPVSTGYRLISIRRNNSKKWLPIQFFSILLKIDFLLTKPLFFSIWCKWYKIADSFKIETYSSKQIFVSAQLQPRNY